MEKINTSQLEDMIRSNFLEKGASTDEIKEEIVKSISEKIKNKSKEDSKVSEEPEEEGIVDVNISKPQDVEGKIPDAVTSSVEMPEELEKISEKEAELEAKEQELAKREEELNQREASLSSKELENEYEPELPEQIEELEPEKLFVFDENDISVGAEKLSTLEMNSVSNPEEKISMRNMWLKDAVKDVEIYVAKFEKIGNIEFDPFEGTATLTPDISDEKEEIDSEDVKLDMQGNMKDSIEPVADVTQPIINEGVEKNAKSKQLYLQLKQLIRNIAEEEGIVDYTDFAAAVASILEDMYGTHIYAPFIKELKKQLSDD